MMPPPTIPETAIAQLLRQVWGLSGELQTLVSERDQNFRLTTADGECFVVKIANSGEDPLITDFQIQALLHLERNDCPVAVPRVIPTRDGALTADIEADGAGHLVRVLTYQPGTPVSGLSADARPARDLGMALANLDLALADFEHDGDHQHLYWDMQRVLELRPRVQHIPDAGLKAQVDDCLDDFEQDAMPRFASLRRQVIHNDLNPGNALVTADGTVAGVIDFGDMLRAPLIVDVAVGASYLRSDEEDALALAISFAAGFDAVCRLDDVEISLLHLLLRTRLATTITMLYWRKSLCAGDDTWLQESLLSEQSSERYLVRANAVPAEELAARVIAARDR